MLLTDFDALTFDCYGTLIDWESGMVEALKALTDRAQRPLTRDQILEAHARHESSQQHSSRKCRQTRNDERQRARARHIYSGQRSRRRSFHRSAHSPGRLWQHGCGLHRPFEHRQHGRRRYPPR